LISSAVVMMSSISSSALASILGSPLISSAVVMMSSILEISRSFVSASASACLASMGESAVLVSSMRCSSSLMPFSFSS